MFEPSRAGEFWAVPRNSCPDVRPNGMFGLDVDVRDGPLIIGGRRLTCLVTCFFGFGCTGWSIKRWRRLLFYTDFGRTFTILIKCDYDCM